MTDLPRPAAPLLNRWGAVPRLRNIRIQKGEVYGERPGLDEVGMWWSPVEEYYGGRKPHMNFVGCAETETAVVDFVKRYGALADPFPRTEVNFRLLDFHDERWYFNLFLELAGCLHRPESIRSTFLNRLEDAFGRSIATSSGRCMTAISFMLAAIDAPNKATALQENKEIGSLWRRARQHLQGLGNDALVRAAESFVAREVSHRLGWVSHEFTFNSHGEPKLVPHCDGLLAYFYWMVVQDILGPNKPIRCAYCGSLFFSSRQSEVYCPDRRECKERGRRRLDWQRNKDIYNRNRKLKRLKVNSKTMRTRPSRR